MWNYVEVFPLICILVSVNEVGSKANEFVFTYNFYILQTVTIFFLYLKLMFFMRLFRKTGYLVYAIVKVFRDMTNFLIVFGLVIC